MNTTRHNVGVYWLDSMRQQFDLVWQKSSELGVDYMEAIWTPDTPTQLGWCERVSPTMQHPQSWRITMMTPHGYMNTSGRPVVRAMTRWQLKPSQLLVVHDDMERQCGKVSLKSSGSANGHNGVKSIVSELRTDKFHRLRIGIDRPESRSANVVAKYVLRNFHSQQRKTLEDTSFVLAFSELLMLISRHEQQIEMLQTAERLQMKQASIQNA
ncbi:peptidyl-tRNA hydrolase [Syncephalis plumigaleata]|nr:peptidyl-tRNA hydrolase [Syncephalis plumigaleata]